MVDAFLGKKYKLASSENFDEYMKAVGVGLVTRKVGGTATSTTWLTKDGDTYTLHTESTFKNNTVSFKLGVETDEETIDGRKVKSTFTVEGSKLIQSQKGEHNSTLTREFSDAELKGIYVSGGVTCTRVFKAI